MTSVNVFSCWMDARDESYRCIRTVNKSKFTAGKKWCNHSGLSSQTCSLKRVKYARIKRTSSAGLVCHDVFIPLKTLLEASTVRKYFCHQERSFGRQLSYQLCVFAKRFSISYVLKTTIPQTCIGSSSVLRRIVILIGIFRLIQCVEKCMTAFPDEGLRGKAS